MPIKLPLLLALFGLLLSACSAMFTASGGDLLGDPAPLTAATRAIAIGPGTRHINVTGGEIIRFDVGDRSFAWNFNGAQYLSSFDLRKVAPADLLNHEVVAYIAPNPLYFGRDRGGADGGGSGGLGSHGADR